MRTIVQTNLSGCRVWVGYTTLTTNIGGLQRETTSSACMLYVGTLQRLRQVHVGYITAKVDRRLQAV